MNITMLAKSGAFINLIDLLMMTGLFFAFIFAAFSGRIFSTPIRNFVIMMIVVYGLLKPASDVMIIDERTGQNYNVSNVPLGVALFGYFQSSLSRDLVNFFENSLNGGDFYASYAKYGFGFGPFSTKAIVEFMNSPAISNGNPEYGRLMTNLSRFAQECFGYSAAQGNNFVALMAIKAMPGSNDAFRIFLGQDPSYPYINSGLSMDYVNSDNSITSEDCKTAGAQIYSDIKNLINSSQLDQAFVNQVQGMLSANPATLDPDLQTALQYHFNSLSQLDNLKMNILFSSMAYDFVKLGASGLSNNASVSNYAVNSILGSAKMGAIQQAVENFGQGAIAVALAPKMLNFTKMMYYLLFFVLLTLALTPLARSIGKVTLVFFVFLTILEPLYVLLNYLLNTMAYYQATSSGTCNNSPAGILSCLDINSLFYTNALNISILGLVGLAYALASAIVTGSGAVIAAIGDKFGSGAITYQGANNNIGSLSNFLNDPAKALAAQNTTMSSFIADGGAGFQSSLANIMATQSAMRGSELGASLATYDGMKEAITKDSYTKDGVKYTNAKVGNDGRLYDFNTAQGSLDQLLGGLANSGNESLAKLGASLQFLRNRMGGNVSTTIIKGDDGYTVKFNMGDAGTRGEQSIIIGKDGRFIKGNISTGDGNSISITDDGRVLVNGKEATKDVVDAQKSFEDLKTVTLGHNLAKKLDLKVSDAEARMIGNIASKSHNFQEFVRNLTDLLTSYTHKDGRKDGHKAGESHSDSSGYGFSIDAGALMSLVGKLISKLKGGGGGGGDNPLGPYYKEGHEDKVNEGKYEEKGADNSKGRNVNDVVSSGTLDSFIKELKHIEQDSRTNSIIKEKDFEDVKSESYTQVYREAEKATFTKKLEEQYGISLTGQALEKLEEAVQSGDTGRILSVLAEIAADAKNWKSLEASQYQEKKEQTQAQAGETAGNVSGQTTAVPTQTRDSDAAAQEAQEKAAKAKDVPENINVNTKDPFGDNFHIKAPKGFYKDVKDVKQQVEKALMKDVNIKDFENPQKVLPYAVDIGKGAVQSWEEGYPAKGQWGRYANWGVSTEIPTPPPAKNAGKNKTSQNKQNE